MEEVKLDAKNIEDNKKKAIAQRLNINVEDIPQEIVDNDELGDLLIFGGEVKESFAASARKIKESGIETISMGYILVDGGRESATARITGTRPLPASDSERIADTALAGEMLGLHSIYLEAGSGALHPAGGNLIRIVRSSIRVPLIVGGGMHSAAEAEAAWGAGADIVVIGNHLEESPADLALFVEARNKMNTHQMLSAVM